MSRDEMATEDLIEIAYTSWSIATSKRWMRIETLATLVSRQDLGEAIKRLVRSDDNFRAEPNFMMHHGVSEWDKANAPVIGGEPMHLICWVK